MSTKTALTQLRILESERSRSSAESSSLSTSVQYLSELRKDYCNVRSVGDKLSFAETTVDNGTAVEVICIFPYVPAVWPGRHLSMSFVKGCSLGCSPG